MPTVALSIELMRYSDMLFCKEVVSKISETTACSYREH